MLQSTVPVFASAQSACPRPQREHAFTVDSWGSSRTVTFILGNARARRRLPKLFPWPHPGETNWRSPRCPWVNSLPWAIAKAAYPGPAPASSKSGAGLLRPNIEQAGFARDTVSLWSAPLRSIDRASGITGKRPAAPLRIYLESCRPPWEVEPVLARTTPTGSDVGP
jgi:hypothetical protein